MAITVKTSITTETAVTTTTEKAHKYAPTYYYPIEENDFVTKKYFEDKGIPVVTINRYGKDRWFALVPDSDFTTATDDEIEAIYARADVLSRKLDNMRRTSERKAAKVKKKETSSLDTMISAGYDPTLDNIKVGITITETTDEEDDNSITDEHDTTENNAHESENENIDNVECDDSRYEDSDADTYGFKPAKARGMYNSFSDENNPEYIYAKSELYSKLYQIVEGLSKDDKEIIKMIISDTKERDKATELDIHQSTLNSKKKRLMAKLRAELKVFSDLC